MSIFTGYTDRWGQRIKEGDVLGEEGNPFAVVVWDSQDNRFRLKFLPEGVIDHSRMTLEDWFDHWKYTDWKVLGNIHENPELIKKRGIT